MIRSRRLNQLIVDLSIVEVDSESALMIPLSLVDFDYIENQEAHQHAIGQDCAKRMKVYEILSLPPFNWGHACQFLEEPEQQPENRCNQEISNKADEVGPDPESYGCEKRTAAACRLQCTDLPSMLPHTPARQQ